MRYYKLLALAAIFLCGSSFASDVYFVCDTAKGTIKLDENNGVILRAFHTPESVRNQRNAS